MTTRTWDLRLRTPLGMSLSLLVDAEGKEQAEAQAVQDCMDHDYPDCTVEWCIEYPPKRKVRSSVAITD